MAVKLNEPAFAYARNLVRDGRYVVDGRDAFGASISRPPNSRTSSSSSTGSARTPVGIWASTTR